MLVFVTTAAHAYTHEQVVRAATHFEVRVISLRVAADSAFTCSGNLRFCRHGSTVAA
jgi:hypothetical protein